jgi:hypothetical protein
MPVPLYQAICHHIPEESNRNFRCPGNLKYQNSVMFRPIARQRLGKHIPAGANARINRTSIARQRISKHA